MVRNWKSTTIGAIATFQGGSQPPLATFSSFAKKNFVRLIQIRDYKSDKFITYAPMNLCKRFCVKDDIMIGRYGPPIFQILRGLTGAYNVALIKAIPKNIEKEYLFYTLKREDLFQYIELLSRRSSGQTGVDLTGLKEFEIIIPSSSDEQKAIAGALSDIDQLISATEKLIAKKQDIKKGLMQELLTGKRRIGIKCLSPFKSSELGDIPADWRVLKIGDTFRFLTNNTYSRSAMNSDGGTYRNIHYGDILTRYNEIVDCTYDELPFLNSDIKVRENALLHTGDIIFADTAEDETVGKAIELLNVDNRAICAGLHTVALRPHEDIFANGFLGYFLNSEAFHSSLLPYVTGIKVSSISKTTIKNSLVLCPPKEEQAAIANALRDIDQDIFSQKSKLHKLHALKAGMMSELLTGRIRLSCDTCSVKAKADTTMNETQVTLGENAK